MWPYCVHGLFQALSSGTVAFAVINSINGTSVLYPFFFAVVKGAFQTREIVLVFSPRRNLGDVSTKDKECIL